MKYKTTSEQIHKPQQIELKQRDCTDRIGKYYGHYTNLL